MVTVLIVGVALAVLVYPVTYMRTGLAEANALPPETESRSGIDILKEDFDYPAVNPIQVSATLPGDALDAKNLVWVEELGREIEDAEGVDEAISAYTVGKRAAETYAGRVVVAQEEAEAEAANRAKEAVEQQLGALRAQHGYVPPGAEESLRAEAERRAAEELSARIPDLPDGVFSDGTVTAEGVANFLDTEAAEGDEDLQEALERLVSGGRVLVRAVPTDDPSSAAGRLTVERVRAIEPPTGVASFSVGGLSAEQKDALSVLFGRSAFYAGAFVLGATCLMLFFVFRSAVVALKGVLVNSLSLVASLGVVVLVFQEGHLSGLLNFTPSALDAIVPVLILCVVFGISMDYEIFLLSRIKEAYDGGASPPESVKEGLATTGGIITSAAAILVTVTGAFAFTDILQIKALGLGIAVAVLLDATVVRLILVPAVMRLLGDAAWWPAGRRKTRRRSRKMDSATERKN